MNERIKELATEATDWMFDNLDNFPMPSSRWKEKFAELIIRECADICINENVSNLDSKVMLESGKFTVQDLATKSCGENLSKRIKEHFGVEE